MIDALLDGQQACLFAYGQTGSGKTFSLLGAEGGKNPHKLNGIVPQIVSELFRRFSSLENQGIKHYIWASFVEVYNERIRDLCDEPDKYGNQPYLGIRETKDGPVFISSGARPIGEATVPVHSSRALLQVIEGALAKRVNSANDYHDHSSRSHAMLTLKLEKRVGTTSQTNSLLLVDLAGSESYNSVMPHAKINVSLLALGRVLKSLAKGQSHKPYRDSVLTRLLQPILEKGGSMCMLACIHPGAAYAGETNAVLDYAKTTATIVQTVVRAEVTDTRTEEEKKADEEKTDNAGDDPYAAHIILPPRSLSLLAPIPPHFHLTLIPSHRRRPHPTSIPPHLDPAEGSPIPPRSHRQRHSPPLSIPSLGAVTP